MRTIVLTGGGTAGHVLPNIALLPELKKRFDRICYLGGNGVEKEIAIQNGLEYFSITTVKLRRKLTLKNLAIPFKLWRGIREAKKILRQLKPDVIFSKGGFVALPVVLASSSLKIKVIAHESDLSLGLANRLTVKKCQQICCTFPIENKKYPNLVQTGAIIRPTIYQGNRSKIKTVAPDKPNLLIMGGSSGATAINNVVWQIVATLTKSYNVLHLTGKGKSNQQIICSGYQQIEYLDHPEDAYAWADVVVARAGAGTVTELLALKKPALYIPLPKTESRGDQIENAKFMQRLGVCDVLEQENLSSENFCQKVEAVWRQRQTFSQKASEQIWVDGTQKVISYLQ